MSYHYCEQNILETPQRYMYTKFEGISLIQDFIKVRQNKILSLNEKNADESIKDLLSLPITQQNAEIVKQLKDIIDSTFALENDKTALKSFCFNEEIETIALVRALISAQLSDENNDNISIWINRLIQRFEVSKKLFQYYPAGFRKAHGTTDNLTLYLLLLLSLNIAYSKTRELKYLATLLKVSDLLCSIDNQALLDNTKTSLLINLWETEVLFIKELCAKQGIDTHA